MRARRFWLPVLVLALPVSPRAQAPSPPPVTAIVGATVVNLDGGPPIRDAAVVIENDRIAVVGPATSTRVPPGAQVIRASGLWMVPGLMNMHVHLGLKLPGRMAAELANESEAAQALRMAANARMSLLSGVTTVRLTGEDRHADFALKRAVELGQIDGPRIFTAGRAVHVTGGHGTAPSGEGHDGPAELRKAVRREVFAGASWIKIAISGGISDERGAIGASHMTREEMEAVIDTAHRHGVKVTAHSGSPVATEEAVALGLDCVEHGYFLTPETLRRMKENGTWLVPTIVVSRLETGRPFFEKIGAPPWYMQRVASVGEHHWEMLRNAIKEGVRIALGTDMFPFEPNDATTATIREAQYYVEAGMTPLQALRAATIEPATMLDAADRVGSIEKGKYADLLLVDEDPARDIRALRRIRLVMKGGKVYRDELAASGTATRPNQ